MVRPCAPAVSSGSGRRAFVAALALLVVNDVALKPLFSDAVTGKLSDFAGLFALTYFAAALLPWRRYAAGCVIAAAFALWKTSYAQPLIDAWNARSPFALGRTVDATDLVALPMIALAAWVAPWLRPWPLPRALQVGLAVVAPVAFAATSRLPEVVRMTADVPVSTVDESDEAALEVFFDELAARHGLRCTICDPLDEGRVYGTDDRALTGSYAADSRTLYMEASDLSGRSARAVEKLGAVARDSLDERFPGITFYEVTSRRDEPLQVTTFKIRISEDEETLSVERTEGPRRTLSSIIEDVVRAHGLETAAPFYYAGRRRNLYERDLMLVPSFGGNATFQLYNSRHNEAYAELHRALSDDLAGRLRDAFGAANVTIAVR